MYTLAVTKQKQRPYPKAGLAPCRRGDRGDYPHNPNRLVAIVNCRPSLERLSVRVRRSERGEQRARQAAAASLASGCPYGCLIEAPLLLGCFCRRNRSCSVASWRKAR